MKIYIDEDHKCHVEESGETREFDVPFFDGKCKVFIEGYRYIPDGETWEREDGRVFRGEMFAPWRDYGLLEIAQSAYEEALAERTDMEDALNRLGVSV